jgi:hypothetical protein
MDSDLDTLNFFVDTELLFGGADEDGLEVTGNTSSNTATIAIVGVIVFLIIAGIVYFTLFSKKTPIAESSRLSETTTTTKPIAVNKSLDNKSESSPSGGSTSGGSTSGGSSSGGSSSGGGSSGGGSSGAMPSAPIVPMSGGPKVATPTNTPTGPAPTTPTQPGPAQTGSTPTGPPSSDKPKGGLTPEEIAEAQRKAAEDKKKADDEAFQKEKARLKAIEDEKENAKLDEEARIKKQKKIAIKICTKDRVEPCAAGFLTKEFIDPVTFDKATCCIIDPSRNDPAKIKEALDLAASRLKALEDRGKISLENRVSKELLSAKEKYNPITLKTTINKLANSLSKKYDAKALAESEEIGAAQIDSIESNIIKNLTMAAKDIEKEYGGSMGSKLSNQSSNSNLGSMDPKAWAGMAFDAYQTILNMGDPGGYQNVTFLDQYIKIRDKTNEIWNSELQKNNIPTPVVIGPLTKMAPGKASDPVSDSNKPETLRALGQYIFKEFIINYTNQVLQVIDLTQYSNAEQYEIIAVQVKNASSFFDKEAGQKYFDERMCNLAEGLFVDGKCSYKDKNTCDASYDWNDLKNNKDSKENYVEFRDNKCILVNPTLRRSCEDNKMEYDYDKQLCKITDEYCKEKGIGTIDTPNGKDCKLEMGQSIAEKIFGTTIVRGLVQVFDPSQYKPCKSDEKDGNNLPGELKTAIYASIALPPPLNIPGILYATLGNKTCINTAGCQAPKHNEAGLCYDKCKDGFKSDGATFCYKEYPDFQNNGMGHTVTSVTKKVITNTGRPLSYCDPNSKEKGGALCYPKCKDGFSSDGATQCYKNVPPNWPGKSTIAHLQHNTIYDGPGKPLTSCNDNQEKGGALCYPKCKDGFSSDGATQCYKNPPQHWPGTTTLTHLQHKTHYSGPGKPLSHCNPDQDKGGALCYPKCRDGFKSDGVAICYGTCPAGSVDVGALCRDGCREGYHDVAGVCWENTPAGAVNVGALIRDGCRAGFRDVAGVCWGSCPGGWNDDGATCRENLGWNGCCNKGAYGECLGCATGGTVRAKESYVPATRARQSYVPATKAKPSYGRGAGEPLKCAPGLEQRGALCYEDCSKHNANGIEFERRNDNIDMCSTKCPPGFTNIGVGGCQKEGYSRGAGEPLKCEKGLEQRGALCYQDCSKHNANGIEYERRNDNIDMCSTKCPPGFSNIGIGGCQKEAYNRGAGEPMSCQPNELEKSKGLCYDKCPDGYQDQSLGLCSQGCPSGSKDFGVGCTREAYNRGAGTLPFSIYVKERLIPYGKKDK